MDPAVQGEILNGEHALIQAQVHADMATVQRLLSEQFQEIGSSGHAFGKSAVIDSLTRSQVLDFSLLPQAWIEAGPDCVILVYLAEVTRRRNGRAHTSKARRSSTWRREAEGWRMLFHQATPIPDLGPVTST